ncbi:anti-sigma B factor RsbW [Serpentinicella alkaliphila]|uniref:Serine/threonine-protein kinase RsbW n=1 Tax=Serpentinicella alkaliphila TaxID=1734049 RepID=A0A4R2SPN7_9FIRM|nr:anti-sigma B factor RsbW [Serpentinicella alkaliphila]TCP92119.1 serine/threonine-protein kinase RsbW [Serpentinicella alkaliphila]
MMLIMEDRYVMNNQKDLIKLSLPNKPEYVSVVRLTLSSIASRMGFDIEKIEDLKVAVSEACSNAITHGANAEEGNFDVEFLVYEEKIDILVYDKGKGFLVNQIEEPNVHNLKEGGLGVFIIKSLMDNVEFLQNKGKGTVIKMTKYVGDDFNEKYSQ